MATNGPRWPETSGAINAARDEPTSLGERRKHTVISVSLLLVQRRPRVLLLLVVTSRTSVLLIPDLSHIRSYYGPISSVTLRKSTSATSQFELPPYVCMSTRPHCSSSTGSSAAYGYIGIKYRLRKFNDDFDLVTLSKGTNTTETSQVLVTI